MRVYRKIFLILLAPALALISCKKELNVGNPNQPTLDANVTDENGLMALTSGAVYLNGIGNGSLGWLGNSYLSLPYGYSELLGDMISAEASNQIVNIINFPEYYILDNGTRVDADSKMRTVVRTNNTRSGSSQGNNPFLYIWTSMYAMNNACNTVLSKVDAVSYTGDAEIKKNTIKAFCYFWKGWAYSQIGSWYYAGLINDAVTTTNSDYKKFTEIIAESKKNLNACADILGTLGSGGGTYDAVLGKLIPSFLQVDKGGILSPAQWKRNINTLLARNILVNHLSPFVNNNPGATISGSSMDAMSAQDWQDIIQLTNDGIGPDDLVFTARSADVNGFTTAAGGNVAAQSTGPAASATFKIGERFIQNFRANDKRFEKNFTLGFYGMNSSFSTRYSQVDGGNAGNEGTIVYGNKNVGEYEAYLAGTYEENALMLAEAKIRTGDIAGGVALIDDVREYQGAGLPALSTSLSLADAMKELVSERRVALVYRGLSFFDSRRWGWIYDISKGGGVYGQTVVIDATHVNTNVTINYNFLDYWDVPADESDLNPPLDGAVIKNPN